MVTTCCYITKFAYIYGLPPMVNGMCSSVKPVTQAEDIQYLLYKNDTFLDMSVYLLISQNCSPDS